MTAERIGFLLMYIFLIVMFALVCHDSNQKGREIDAWKAKYETIQAKYEVLEKLMTTQVEEK